MSASLPCRICPGLQCAFGQCWSHAVPLTAGQNYWSGDPGGMACGLAVKGVLFFLYLLLNLTYVIDFESHRTVHSCFHYVLDSTFMISDHVMNLKEFEKCVEDDVRGVYQLTMKAGGNVRGVPLTMVSAIRITTPTPYATKTSKKQAENDAAFSEGDSCEEVGKEGPCD